MEFKLKLTCRACPEQYDVYDGDKYIGYIRYRYGFLKAQPVDEQGTILDKILYSWENQDDLMSGSIPDDLRNELIGNCIRAIIDYYLMNTKEIKYTIEE